MVYILGEGQCHGFWVEFFWGEGREMQQVALLTRKEGKVKRNLPLETGKYAVVSIPSYTQIILPLPYFVRDFQMWPLTPKPSGWTCGKRMDEKWVDELFSTDTVNGRTPVENFHKDVVEWLNGCKKFLHGWSQTAEENFGKLATERRMRGYPC